MGFSPVIPLDGLAGWRFLQKTQTKQQASFEKSAEVQRDIAYFTENIGKITRAEDLVADRRLLKVALGAFGLEGEIDKKAFVRKVLEEGTSDPKALAARLTDKSFAKLSDAFGFGSSTGARTATAGFAAKITDAYKTRAFEVAVGDVNDNMRLAMNFKREIATLAASDTASWFSVLGSKPLRQVVEGALGLPKEFSQLDIDKQKEIIVDRIDRQFGGDTLKVFADPQVVEKMIDRFLVRAQIAEGTGASGTPAANALALLQASNGGASSSGIFNLLASKV